MLDNILSIIAPHSCLGCGREGDVICTRCVANLPTVPSRCYRCCQIASGFKTCKACRRQSSLQSVFPATAYKDVAKQTVRALKYEHCRAAVQPMVSLMAERLGNLPAGCVVAYVPTATNRLRTRGYDQAELIAKELAAKLKLPYAPLLRRMGQRRQVGATRAERRAQLKEDFRPIHPYIVAQNNILIVDDVITTGSTLEAAARTLRQAGAGQVYAAVFAAA